MTDGDGIRGVGGVEIVSLYRGTRDIFRELFLGIKNGTTGRNFPKGLK